MNIRVEPSLRDRLDGYQWHWVRAIVVGVPAEGPPVDLWEHIFGHEAGILYPLDGDWSNLMIDNVKRTKGKGPKASKLPGVYRQGNGRWRALTTKDNKTHHIGYAATEEEAFHLWLNEVGK